MWGTGTETKKKKGNGRVRETQWEVERNRKTEKEKCKRIETHKNKDKRQKLRPKLEVFQGEPLGVGLVGKSLLRGGDWRGGASVCRLPRRAFGDQG